MAQSTITYTGLHTLLCFLEVSLTVPLQRGKHELSQAPTGSTLARIIEKRVEGFTPKDLRTLADDLDVPADAVFLDMTVPVSLKKRFYEDYPLIAAQLNQNEARRAKDGVDSKTPALAAA